MKSAASRAGRLLLFFFLAGASAAMPFSNAEAADGTPPPVIPAATPSASGSNAIRIYNCDQQVQSSKRGLCANHLAAEDIQALAPGVSWYYNWSFSTDDTLPKGVHFDFVPMVWGTDQDVDRMEDYLSSHPKPRAVLAINEPNIRGQAFISPEETAALYNKIKAVADKYGVPVIGPNLSMGSGPDDSITAMDPIEKRTVTYRDMASFLKAFNFYMDKTQVPATVFHSYGNLGEIQWAVGMMHQTFNKPVWVTEYAQWKSNSPQQIMDYMIKATDFLESSPDVGGYAWYKERNDNNASTSLFEEQSGKLTPLGQAYVALPVHDADIYYRIPGKLKAERYATAASSQIERTTDTGGLFDMSTHKVGLLDYHIQVDKAGRYKLNLRVSGPPGAIDIMQNDQVLATVKTDSQTWHDTAATVKLAAGPQTIRIRTSGQSINWIDFSKP